MPVWSVNVKGTKIVSKVIKVGSSLVPKGHIVIHLVLSDKRELWVSPNHPTADGRVVGNLTVGEKYDGSIIHVMKLVSYTDAKTYDLLPAGDTGYYFANGILMGSTLN